MPLAQLKNKGRGGFTLPEMLVAVSMVGVLAAVVLPTIIGQISKGETSRVVQDLQSVEQANQMFRSDVGKYPGSIAHLVAFASSLDNTAAALAGGTYANNASDLWEGPYLARGDVTGGLVTSGGTISLTLESRDWDGTETTAVSNFVAIAVTGLTATEKDLIDKSVDGTAGANLNLASHGKIRYNATTLYYYTSPAN